MLGSLIPSSPFLVQSLLAPVVWERARLFIEQGPGVGTFTREILKRMSPEARLIAIETNGEFVEYLRRTLPDPRLEVVHGSAEDSGRLAARAGTGGADYVISGIPFSTMSPQLRTGILRSTRAALAPGGKLLLYQFSTRVHADLRRMFGRIERGFEPLNILPAQLFFCSAPEAESTGAAAPREGNGAAASMQRT